MKNFSKKYLVNFTLIISLTIVALWFALKDNYQEVIVLIRDIKWYWLILILLWGIIYTMIIGWILKVFARRYKKDYTFLQGIQNSFVGSFFSGITPSSTGGQFAQAYIFKKQGIKVSEGASLLWADFIVYQTTMMIYVTALFAFRFAHYKEIVNSWFLFILIGYILNVCVISALWTMALFPKIYLKLSGIAVNLLSKIRIIKNKQKTLDAWTEQLNSFTEEIKQMRHEKQIIAKTVLLNVLRLTVLYSLPFVIARTIGIDLPWYRLMDVIAISSFVSMANSFIPIPGASGGTELVFTALFVPLIGGGATASSVMILWRFSTYHFVILVGGITFILLKRKFDKKKMEKI